MLSIQVSRFALRADDGAARRYRDSEVAAIARHAAEEQVAHLTEAGMSLGTVQ